MTGRSPAARALIAAIAAQERDDLATAAEAYRCLAARTGTVAAIARNNLAVVLDQQGSHREAHAGFQHLLAGGGSGGAVAAYNLSRMYAGPVVKDMPTGTRRSRPNSTVTFTGSRRTTGGR
ncbi:hypothetical protein ACIBKY_54545 [Nonomuraea sp. NPDC050394]|uniref:hypothetical protein n=1 Tax=Nonomuraea sp. NPDC050394 TaxID=3364363 RepID=UPI0037BC0574